MLISPKYEVLAEIGRGGMGIVYKVRHTALDTIAALKILPAHLAEDHELVGRFHREARVMAKLRHPNIVRVVDVDKVGDLHFFVMEFVEGRSFSKIIADEGPRPLAEVLDVAIQVTRAIAYAHAQRPAVIHRDLKPSNILIDADDHRAVVTDFGLAKLAGGAESLQTESGKFIGTLRYCAPEQLTGAGEVDERVDVYAMGMMIYESCAGRSAYVDLERPQVIAGLLQISVAHPFQFGPDVPQGLRDIVLRATAKDRAKRYPTAAALLADLERCAATISHAAHESTVGTGTRLAMPTTPGRGRLIAAVTVLLLALAGGGGLLVRRALVADGGGTGGAAGGPAAAAPSPAKPESAIRKFVSVMDFALRSPDPQFGWMRDAIRDNLNSRLSGAPDCKVFSKEFIDFKAQQMVREGRYADPKAAAMEVAQNLGVTKAVIGSVRADRETLHIEAHLVDMATGVQEAPEVVEGPQDDFVVLQAKLAEKLMARLGVTPPPPDTETVQAAEAGGDLESYRLLLQAEGRAAPVEPKPAATETRKGGDRRSDVPPIGAVAALARLLDVGDAGAVESTEAAAAAEQAIRETLEAYRRACEQKDVDALVAVYDQLSPAQVEANRRYFANARDLAVAFEEIDVAVGEHEAAVSYTRRDRFTDAETERPTKVEVRLTKMLVLVDGRWKLVSGQKH